MSHPVVSPLPDEAIDPELLQLVQFFKGPLGVIPNSVRTMARRPHLARAFTQLNQAVMLSEGRVTPELKRLIGYVTSYVHGCRYCQAHTILGSERFGASEQRLHDVFAFADSPHFSEAEKAALAFAHAAAEVPSAVSGPIVADLRAHWDEGEIVEILGVVALFGYLNRWNDAIGSTLEDLPLDAAERHLRHTGWDAGKHGR